MEEKKNRKLIPIIIICIVFVVAIIFIAIMTMKKESIKDLFKTKENTVETSQLDEEKTTSSEGENKEENNENEHDEYDKMLEEDTYNYIFEDASSKNDYIFVPEGENSYVLEKKYVAGLNEKQVNDIHKALNEYGKNPDLISVDKDTYEIIGSPIYFSPIIYKIEKKDNKYICYFIYFGTNENILMTAELDVSNNIKIINVKKYDKQYSDLSKSQVEYVENILGNVAHIKKEFKSVNEFNNEDFDWMVRHTLNNLFWEDSNPYEKYIAKKIDSEEIYYKEGIYYKKEVANEILKDYLGITKFDGYIFDDSNEKDNKYYHIRSAIEDSVAFAIIMNIEKTNNNYIVYYRLGHGGSRVIFDRQYKANIIKTENGFNVTSIEEL